MKKMFFSTPWIAFLALCLFTLACKKNNSAPAKSQKYQIVTGAWNQSDIVLGVAVSVKVGGTKYNFPAGTSVITNPYLKAFGVTALFKPTTTNIYHFTDSGSYRIEGNTSLILPVAGNTGAWTLDVYDAVLKLTTASRINDPHWINAITPDSLSLSLTVKIPGLGTAPLSLLLHKQ
jgi:hypothetical protein